MKLGLFLLLLGVLLAGVGAAAWALAEPDIAFWGGQHAWEEHKVMEAGGVGGVVLGSGLALAGAVRMILRKD